MKKLFLYLFCLLLFLCFQQSNAQSKKSKRKHKTEQQTPAQTGSETVLPNNQTPPGTTQTADTAGLTVKPDSAITTNATTTATNAEIASTAAFTDEEVAQRLAYFYAGNWKTLKSKAEKEKKVFMVDFYTDWCRVCKQMDREIFAHDQTIQLFNRYFLAYKLNAEKSEKSIAENYGITAYPTFIFFDYKGNELGRITGYLEKESFLQQLNQYKPKTPNTRYTKFR